MASGYYFSWFGSGRNVSYCCPGSHYVDRPIYASFFRRYNTDGDRSYTYRYWNGRCAKRQPYSFCIAGRYDHCGVPTTHVLLHFIEYPCVWDRTTYCWRFSTCWFRLVYNCMYRICIMRGNLLALAWPLLTFRHHQLV